MLFNSLDFLIFFPVVVACYFAAPQRARWAVLLVASYVFYAFWRLEYLILILASTGVDYWAGLMMAKRPTRAARRPFLVVSLVSNLGLLFSFKYLSFFNESIRTLFEGVGVSYGVPAFDILLPVGISFYTFQTLSYAIDVYRGECEAERHFGIFALYVSFFPQLVAGPIERSGHLLPQFRERASLEWPRVADGLKLMAWGLFKKVVIADRLALYVNAVYDTPDAHRGGALLVATYFFAFQIYCDFSGYTDIAVGSARVMGYDLMENFRRPYFSKSIGEFWRRWHISLSSWFRDYLYIPLGGNQVPVPRWYLNLFVVFVVSGLWHGANWTFVVWGALHGSYLILEAMTSGPRERVWARVGDAYDLWQASEHAAGTETDPNRRRRWARGPRSATIQGWVKIFITFHLVLISWVFFRASSLSDAFVVFQRILDLRAWTDGLVVGLSSYELLLALAGIAVLEAVHLVERKEDVRSFLSKKPGYVRFPVYASIVLAILMFGEFGVQEFIYFQF